MNCYTFPMDDKEILTPKQLDECVLKAQQGNTDSFAQIYDQFVDKIYKYVFFRVGREDALDLTESVFLKVWENIKSYKTGKQYVSSWIYRIAHNAVVDHYRMSKQTVELTSNVPDMNKDSDPIVLTARKMNRESLSKAISKLKRKYQQVIVLKYVNELDNKEIARIMNKTEGSMRILKFRALKALKQILEEMNVGY